MSSDENIQTARRFFDRAFSTGDLAVIDEIVAADFVEHQNGAEGTGPEAVKRIVAGLRKSFPDLTLTIQDVVASGDDVWVRVRARGTDSGGVAGRAPTGTSVEIDVIDVLRFRGGRIVEHWGVADRLGMLQQVGVVPRPQQDRQIA